jgi:hypothetical protein
MPAQLLSLEDGPHILLDKPILLIGRHEECDIQLNSRKVSRKHCCVAQVSEYFVVRDLGSTNGVRINGVRVQEGTLKPGDELTIGNHRYQIQGDPTPMPNSPAAIGDDLTGRAPMPMEVDLESSDEPVALPEDASFDGPAGIKLSDRGGSGPPIALSNDLQLPSQSSWPPPQAPPV